METGLANDTRIAVELGSKLVEKLECNPWPRQIRIITPCELSTIGRGGMVHEHIRKVSEGGKGL